MPDPDSAASQALAAADLGAGANEARAALAVAERVRSGDMRAVARLISGLENADPAAEAVLRALRGRGQGHVVGITGPPGSGKSTLTDKLIGALRSRGLRVGVLAVDPSSPFTGGAILGDRLRMQHHATDEGVFIRSLASRGTLGGLSRATAASVRVLEAAGYDWIIVETVGVGQSEVDIVKLADTVVLVSVPGLGDDIQVIKAGIMEIGDIFVVNKSDRDGSDRVVREIRCMLETAAALAWARSGGSLAGLVEAGHHGLSAVASPPAAPPAKPAAALQARGAVTGPGTSGLAAAGQGELPLDADGHPVLPPIIKTVAETGEGCSALVDAIVAHRERSLASGALEMRRLEGARAELRSLMAFRLVDALEGSAGAALEAELARAVVARECDVYEAADRLFATIMKGETS
ncbi:MAG TPA: methylmalonyl Co-A mutase-associated GTPase MeaB [Rectinemataceae bacterium]|nr:methylmalonyl Co-A mutase-associated GTPase MeaB [Rectinemataceae bacterium]